MTSASPAMILCAASAIVCRPDEQKRLTVAPGTVTGQPQRSAIWRPMLPPVAPSGSAQPMSTSSTSSGASFARAIAWATAWPPRSAPCVMLKAPRQLLARPVRAVATTTASVMVVPFRARSSALLVERLAFRREAREQWRRHPEVAVGARDRCEFAQPARDVVQPQHVGVEHRPTAIARKAVAGEVDDVDVGCAQRNALLQDPRTF